MAAKTQDPCRAGGSSARRPMQAFLAAALCAASGAVLAHTPAYGCYVHVFTQEMFRSPAVTYAGPMLKPIELSHARSMIVGPGARLIAFSGRDRLEALDLLPGKRIPDTTRLGLRNELNSYQIDCRADALRKASTREDEVEARPIPALFQRLDRNGDGYLSERELESPAAKAGNWAALDKDGDRRISPDEFTVLPST